VTATTLTAQAKIVPLQSLKAGQWGTVVDLVGTEATVKCLAERGLRDGIRLRMIVPGPSSVCQVGDLTLSLRTCGHCEVFVRLD
jgi:Fe2+ transport system protein FeoA